jgi:hypothetical protein
MAFQMERNGGNVVAVLAVFCYNLSIGSSAGGSKMINKTIANIEARIRQTGAIREDEKTELIKLLSELRAEVTELSETHREQAESIAKFTDVSTHEATREEKDSRLLNLSVDGLTSSVEGFENSHPRLVQIVNRISVMLAGLGI